MNVEAVIWLYILKSDQGIYYTGITNDLGRRMKEHRSGASRSTRRYRNIELVWVKVFEERKEAREWEVKVKQKGAGRWLKTYADKNKGEWLKEGGQV